MMPMICARAFGRRDGDLPPATFFLTGQMRS
jgi:hypothetical protein